jgi:hypothetical protein
MLRSQGGKDRTSGEFGAEAATLRQLIQILEPSVMRRIIFLSEPIFLDKSVNELDQSHKNVTFIPQNKYYYIKLYFTVILSKITLTF